MANYQQIKTAILETPKCPDGLSIDACASCVADRIAQLQANRCWYCRNNRIVRGLTLRFNTHTLMHLVCHNCAEALNGETITFEMTVDQI